MPVRYLMLILFLFTGNRLFAQSQSDTGSFKNTKPGPRLLLKADCRSLLLQPKVSAEYLFTKKLSLELGTCFFWTGQKLHYENFYEQGMAAAFFGVGPSKGYDIFADVKYIFPGGFYLGLGYLYRYSHFENRHSETDVGDHQTQYYTQSECAYSNFGRLEVGGYFKLKNKNLYINPYASLMIGPSDLKLKIDTTGGDPADYNRQVEPVNEKKTITKCILMIGCNFCIDLWPGVRRPREEW